MTLLTDLLTENIDVFINPRPDQADQIKASPRLRLLNYTWPAYTLVAWNARKPMFADARVRRAMTIATNRREIVESQLRGYGQPANTGVHPLHFAYERRYGSFSRSFTLPEGVDTEGVQAELKDGVLSVMIPKKPETQPKRISLRSSAKPKELGKA